MRLYFTVSRILLNVSRFMLGKNQKEMESKSLISPNKSTLGDCRVSRGIIARNMKGSGFKNGQLLNMESFGVSFGSIIR